MAALVTVDELALYSGQTFADEDLDRIEQLLDFLSAEFRAATEQTISQVVDDVEVVEGEGSAVLLVSQLPVTDVSAVAVDLDADGDTDSLTAPEHYRWSRHGILRRRPAGYVWSQYEDVTVTYTHGYVVVPEDVQFAINRWASNVLGVNTDASDLGAVKSESIGTYSVAYLTSADMAAAARSNLTPDVQAVIERYRVIV